MSATNIKRNNLPFNLETGDILFLSHCFLNCINIINLYSHCYLSVSGIHAAGIYCVTTATWADWDQY